MKQRGRRQSYFPPVLLDYVRSNGGRRRALVYILCGGGRHCNAMVANLYLHSPGRRK